jgi:hypothetical protein
VTQEPRGTDQQELDVVEEGRLRALDPVSDELPDPGDHEHHDRRHEPMPAHQGQRIDQGGAHAEHADRNRR